MTFWPRQRHLEAFDQQGYFPGIGSIKAFFAIVTLMDYPPEDTF